MRDFRTFTNDPVGNDPAATDYIGATNINNFLGELEAAVTRSGQTITSDDGTDDSDKTQLAKSLFLHSVKAQQFQDNGSANTYQLTPISGSGGVLLPASYAQMDGARVWFVPAFSNTTNSTLNIGQTTGTLLGSKKALNYTGAALTAGIITAGRGCAFVYSAAADTGTGAWLLDPSSQPFIGGTLTTDTNMSGARFALGSGGTVASATTLTLTGGNFFDISGTTAITGILTTGWQNGAKVSLRFTDASPGQLTYSGTFITPGFANYTPTQFDIIEFTLISGSWQASGGVRADGTAFVRTAATTSVAGIVELATDAETKALTDTVRAVTPSNLGALLALTTQKGILNLLTSANFVTGTNATDALTASLFNVGTRNVRLPGGFIIQWGTQANVTNSTDGSGTNSTVTLPVSFVSGMDGACINLAGTAGGTTTQTAYIAVNASSFKIAGAQSGSNNYFWIAFGK